jgi:hypothetical protein
METRALPPASEPLSSASAGDEDLLDLRIGAALIDLALLLALLVVLNVLIGEASVGPGGDRRGRQAGPPVPHDGNPRWDPFASTLVFVFDGTTEYEINCQHTTEKADEVEQGCEQIVRTFKVD